MEPVEGHCINATLVQLHGRRQHHRQGRHLIRPPQHWATNLGGQTLKGFILIPHHPKLPSNLLQVIIQMDSTKLQPKDKGADL
jgi:hypothetical protein